MSQKVSGDLKILVVGCPGVGKTSFVNRWIKQEFKDDYKATIVSEFGIKVFKYKEDFYRIQLWDIGGQDRSPSLTKVFARDSFGCIVISDVSKEKSLEDSLKWKESVYNESEFIDGGKIPFILVQNKIDLITKEKLEEVKEESKKIAEEHNFVGTFTTDVKNNIGIDEAMNFLIENIIQRLEKYASDGNECFINKKRNDTVQLRTLSQAELSEKKKKQKKCC